MKARAVGMEKDGRASWSRRRGYELGPGKEHSNGSGKWAVHMRWETWGSEIPSTLESIVEIKKRFEK